jgi:hypothetical protein
VAAGPAGRAIVVPVDAAEPDPAGPDEPAVPGAVVPVAPVPPVPDGCVAVLVVLDEHAAAASTKPATSIATTRRDAVRSTVSIVIPQFRRVPPGSTRVSPVTRRAPENVVPRF